MNTSQLSCCVHCDPVLAKFVMGIFPADRLPKNIIPGGFIANTDNSNKPGRHWCAFYFDSSGRAEFLIAMANHLNIIINSSQRVYREIRSYKHTIVKSYKTIRRMFADSIVCFTFSIDFVKGRCIVS